MPLSALQLGNALSERFRRECRISQTEAELWTRVAQTALDRIAADQTWHPWNIVPDDIAPMQPKPPQVGEHRVRIRTLENGDLLLVEFNNEGQPETLLVVPR